MHKRKSKATYRHERNNKTMGDVITKMGQYGSEPVWVMPNLLKTDPKYDVRPYRGNEDEEDRKLQQLADTLREGKQLDAVIVTPDNKILAGHRRVRATLIENERRTARGEPLLSVRCVVDDSPDAFWTAVTSNLHREPLGGMNLALLVKRLRTERGWQGVAGTKQIAKYLRVDTATVTQAERLLTGPKDIQDKVAAGVISVASALDVIKGVEEGHIAADEAGQVLERAKEIQQEKQIEKAIEDVKTGRKSETKAAEDLRPKKRVEQPHVKEAIREKAAEVVKPEMLQQKGKRRSASNLGRNRKELIASIRQFDADGYGPEARGFARWWCGTYAAGIGTESQLRAKWEAMAGRKQEAEEAREAQGAEGAEKSGKPGKAESTPQKTAKKAGRKPEPKPKSKSKPRKAA